jgi:monoterpene epsilon-lactone hydrolase
VGASSPSTATPARRDVELVFGHLDALVDRIGAATDPLAALRRELHDYGRGNVGEGPRLCRCVPAQAGEPRGQWFIPPDADADHRLLFLHGGGWAGGSVEAYRPLIAEIALLTRQAVFGLEYRLTPEFPFPAGFDDALEAFAWIRAHGPEGHQGAAEIGLIGDSAGANLAAAATADLIARHRSTPARLILISPMLDLRRPERVISGIRDRVVSGHVLAGSFAAYRGYDLDPSDPRVSPAAASAAVLQQFPPTLVQVSAIEYLRDQSVQFAAELWRNGVSARLSVWPQMPHVWHFFMQDLPEARQALHEVADFMATDGA